MNLKKHKLLMGSGAVFLILFTVGLFMLFHYQRGYAQQKKGLTASKRALANLNRRQPFPTRENLDRLEVNQKQLQETQNKLFRVISAKQIEPMTIEAARFPTLLSGMVLGLNKEAREKGVKIPDGFAYGFSKYSDGSLPDMASAERLTIQVQAVEVLIKLLFESGIDELTGVKRDVFEDANPSPSGQQELFEGSPSESDLYSSEEITVSFVGDDRDIWQVLNRCSRDVNFLRVTDVSLSNPVKPDASLVSLYREAETQNQSASGQTVPTASRNPNPFFGTQQLLTSPTRYAGTTSGETKSSGILANHKERIVAGQEKVKAQITVRLYRFNRAALDLPEQVDEPSSEMSTPVEVGP